MITINQPRHEDRLLRRWPAARQLGPLRFVLLAFGAVCQVVTVWMTWPLWQVRTTVPHLPVFDLPQFSFGWLMVVTAGVILVRPAWGLTAHWIVWVTASVFDQFRLQPQFFYLAILMSACIWDGCRPLVRWLLASTWLWTGLHKLLSPDWFGHASHWLVARTPLDADSWYLQFAFAVAASEIVLGILACVRPRWAAVFCVPMHVGIVAFLLMIRWNYSVIPWNLMMATCGCWIMWSGGTGWLTTRWEAAVCGICLIVPIGWYGGWVDRGFAAVLYSDWLPRGLITSRSGVHHIRGWGELAVPFPPERRTLRIYFEQHAEPGDKLHISDPRRALDDQFFVLDASRHARSIDIDEFLLPQSRIPGQQTNASPTVSGIGLDERRAIFALSRAGVRMLRAKPDQPIYAVAFTPENYDADLLVHLQGLPNLTQIQLADTSVTDRDLGMLLELRLLTGIGLDRTEITDKGLLQLKELPFLRYVECEDTAITDDALDSVLNRLD